MRRRDFGPLLGCSIAALALHPLAVRSQIAIKRRLVAVLSGSSAAEASRYLAGFAEGMQTLGYTEAQNLEIAYRYADGDLSRLPALAREVVELKPEVVVATNTAGAVALSKATSSIPIVGVTLTDPVGFGMVANFNRPGGNVTGVLGLLESLPGKQLEIAHDVVPKAARTGVLFNLSNQSNVVQWHDIEKTASAMKVQLVRAEVRSADDIDIAFQLLTRERADVLVVLQDSLFLRERRRLSALAAAASLPAVYGYREHVDVGGLISYGVDLRASCRLAAFYVDKILKGAAAGDLPLEFPSKLEMIINLKTARALGVEIAPTLLVRAGELIE